MDESKELICHDDLSERDWQTELPFLDWKANGSLAYALDVDGNLAFDIKDGVELPSGFSQQLRNGLLPLSAPVLRDYVAFQQCKMNERSAEMRQVFQDIHDFIADPDNEEPLPLHILRERPHMAAWLNGENPRYAPTMMEYKIIWPAFIERRRKIRERGLAGKSNLDAILSLLEDRLKVVPNSEKEALEQRSENKLPCEQASTAILPEFQTRIMNKKEAAKYHNKGGVSNPTDYFKGLIEKGMLNSPMGSGRRWQFDKRDFPQDNKTQTEIS